MGANAFNSRGDDDAEVVDCPLPPVAEDGGGVSGGGGGGDRGRGGEAGPEPAAEEIEAAVEVGCDELFVLADDAMLPNRRPRGCRNTELLKTKKQMRITQKEYFNSKPERLKLPKNH